MIAGRDEGAGAEADNVTVESMGIGGGDAIDLAIVQKTETATGDAAPRSEDDHILVKNHPVAIGQLPETGTESKTGEGDMMTRITFSVEKIIHGISTAIKNNHAEWQDDHNTRNKADTEKMTTATHGELLHQLDSVECPLSP